MELLVGQTPNGIVHNLTYVQFATYTNMGIQKAELVAELCAFMTNDRDIWRITSMDILLIPSYCFV